MSCTYTIAIPTWNRAALLGPTLQRLRRLEIPAGVTHEVLVVDNNSTDSTRQVVQQHLEHLPLKYVFEPRQGKSHAGNTAAEHAQGDWMLWIDDDVLVSPHWLAGYHEAALAHPEAAFLGGPIEPRFQTPPAAWITAAWPVLANVFGERRFGPQPFQMDASTLPYGANFAVRTSVQRAYRYDPELGRAGGDLLAGEESVLLMQLLLDGHVGWWAPHAALQHIVPPERANLAYIRRYFAGIARSPTPENLALRTREQARSCRLLRALWSEVVYRAKRLVSPPTSWARALIRASFKWGRLGYHAGRAPWLPA